MLSHPTSSCPPDPPLLRPADANCRGCLVLLHLCCLSCLYFIEEEQLLNVTEFYVDSVAQRDFLLFFQVVMTIILMKCSLQSLNKLVTSHFGLEIPLTCCVFTTLMGLPSGSQA